MRTRRSLYETVGDCSDKGGHNYQPLHHFILRVVLACKRVMCMLRVMIYVVSYKLFWNWIRVMRIQVTSHEVCSDCGFVIWHFLHTSARARAHTCTYIFHSLSLFPSLSLSFSLSLWLCLCLCICLLVSGCGYARPYYKNKIRGETVWKLPGAKEGMGPGGQKKTSGAQIWWYMYICM